MKILKRVLVVLSVVVALATAGFVYWCLDAYPPLAPATAALASSPSVKVSEEDGVVSFEPAENPRAFGFVFIPGARVDYRAYAPALRRIAEKGIFVAIVKVRLNMALFDPSAPERAIAKFPQIKNWAIGGHSLGGVGAANFAAQNPSRFKGIVFWASYPVDDALKISGLKALSIYGTNDMAGTEPFDESRALLPADARFVAIEGGNHAQFGAYGPQSGDREATIPAEAQWTRAADETAAFIESLNNFPQ